MSQATDKLPEKLVKYGHVVRSAISLLGERYTTFHEHIHATLTHLSHAKKQFRVYNKQLRGYIKPKQQKELFATLRKFIKDQKKAPPPIKATIKDFYSLLNQLSKAIINIEKQLKKSQLTLNYNQFLKEITVHLNESITQADHSEALQQKVIAKYKETERYSPAVCEAYVHDWLKRCNEDYIDITFRDCKELTKVGYEACRALYETDKITEAQIDDILAVTREGRMKTQQLLVLVQHLQPLK